MNKKILLIGEFSGLHRNLKKGLIKNGLEVTIYATRDYYKNIKPDIDIERFCFSRKKINNKYCVYLLTEVQRMVSTIFFYLNIKNFKRYDIVQFVSCRPYNFYLENIVYKKIFKLNKKTVMLSAGCDSYYSEKVKGYKYRPCENCKIYDKSKYFGCEHEKYKAKKNNDFFYNNVNKIIPIGLDYIGVYENLDDDEKVVDMIHLPIDLSVVKYKKICMGKKIRIFHPLNKPGFKGTKYIEKAFELLYRKYSDIADFKIDGKMPLDEYIKYTDSVDVVVDQCSSYGYGMAAVYAMAQGKIVLSGLETKDVIRNKRELMECPIINITPDVDLIYKEVEKLLLAKKSDLMEMGRLSRLYVEKYHDAEIVARKYINLYKSIK